MAQKATLTRRQLLRSSAMTAGAALAFSSAGVPLALAQGGGATIRVGVVGCGQRGAQAARDCVKAAPGVKITAIADVFQDRAMGIMEEFKVAEDHCFDGLDGYRKLMALDDVDLVILATPPAFRPIQLTEAIERGKHVFMERPAAICPAGAQLVADAALKAVQRKLAIGGGLQRRHQPACVETMKRIHDGAIGDLVAAQCYGNQGGRPAYARRPGESDVEYQLRNWPFFIWLSGDFIVEQHIDRLDVINWAFNALPETLQSLGGRQARTGPEYGNIYDHFGTEFIYPNDVRTISMCRQIDGADSLVGERVVGTKGSSDCCGVIEGEKPWRYEGPNPDPFEAEMAALLKSIRDDQPINEGQLAADAALCAIMARESAYSRQQFKRSWFMSKGMFSLLPPENLKLSDAKPVEPAPVPGQYVLAGMTPSDMPQKKQKEGGKKKAEPAAAPAEGAATEGKKTKKSK